MEVDNSSFYKYYRPITLFGYTLGSFPIKNVKSKYGLKLKFKTTSLPVILSTIVISSITLVFALLAFYERVPPLLCYFNLFEIAICFYGTLWCNLSCGKIIRAINLIDTSMYDFDTLLKNLNIKKSTTPEVFSRGIFAITMFTPFVSIAISFLWFQTLDYSYFIVIFYRILVATKYCYYCLALSCIYYNCRLVFQDISRAWHLYCRSNCRPFTHINTFCKLVTSLVDLLSTIDEILGTYVLMLFVIATHDIIAGIPRYLTFHMPVISMAIIVGLCSFYLGILVICIDVSNKKCEHFAQEVIEMAIRDMTIQEVVKVRLLLNQVQNNPCRFTAARFFKVNTNLIHSFVSLGIEMCIMFAQNQSLLIQAVKLSGPTTNTTSS